MKTHKTLTNDLLCGQRYVGNGVYDDGDYDGGGRVESAIGYGDEVATVMQRRVTAAGDGGGYDGGGNRVVLATFRWF